MEESKAKRILILSCIGYFSLGIVVASMGPMLAQFAGNNGTTLATIGGVYTAFYLGAFLAQVVLGPLTDKWGQMRALSVSLLLCAFALSSVTFSRWLPLTLVLFFFSGVGFGMANLCGNVLIGRIFNGKSVSPINWLNAFFGIGAFVGPMMVSFSLHSWQTGAPAMWVGAVLMTASVSVLIYQFFNIKMGTTSPDGTEPHKPMRYSAFLWTLGALILIYVGTETAVGGWSTTYLQNTTTLNIEQSALATAGFWLAITAGRMMGALIGSRISAANVLKICLGIALTGVILFMLTYGHGVMSIVSILIIGWGFGAIYPTGMAIMTEAYPHTPGQAASVIIAMGSIGGTIIPWLQGITLDQLGMRFGTYLIALMVVLLIISFSANQWVKKRILKPITE